MQYLQDCRARRAWVATTRRYRPHVESGFYASGHQGVRHNHGSTRLTPALPHPRGPIPLTC
jgi:hypothetical protein